MNSEVRDILKIGLLAVIAVTLVIQTIGGGEPERPRPNAAANFKPAPAQAPNNALANQNAADLNKRLGNPTINNQPLIPEAPPVPAGPPTSMAFAEKSHDFGQVKQLTENKHVFEFTNTGENPLIISDAKGSCGCTVPKYPREPIAPGATGQIEVVFKPNANQTGDQKKQVTITANTEPSQTVLDISAMVEAGTAE